MAHPSIGGIDVLTFNGGVVPGTGENLQDITRINVDGVGLRKTGKKGKPFTLNSIADMDTAAETKSVAASYKALQGTLVTLVDDFQQSFTNVAVLDVTPGKPSRGRTASGGLTAGEYILPCTWLLQLTETS